MSFQLVIAEKPSVARSIAAVIGAAEKQNGYWQGGGYLVSWCIGHLVSLPRLASTTKNTANGGMRICPSCPSRGSSLSRTRRNSSLKFCVPCSTARMWTV